MSGLSRRGFTLVELAVVIVIIGVLAAFGVPRFLKSVERSKAAEAFQYLAAVRSAQERFISKEGIYSDDLANLDITQSTPKYFDVGEITVTPSVDGTTGWSLTITRKAATSSAALSKLQAELDRTKAALSQQTRKLNQRTATLDQRNRELNQARATISQQSQQISRYETSQREIAALRQEVTTLRQRYKTLSSRGGSARVPQSKVLALVDTKLQVREVLSSEPVKSQYPELYDAMEEYFDTDIMRNTVKIPFEVCPVSAGYDVQVNVCGGGKRGQADAVKLAIARAMLKLDATLRPALKRESLLSVDSRIKERKKYGQRGARRKFQFVKR